MEVSDHLVRLLVSDQPTKSSLHPISNPLDPLVGQVILLDYVLSLYEPAKVVRGEREDVGVERKRKGKRGNEPP